MLVDLEIVAEPAEGASNDEGDIWKACDAFTPAVMFFEGDWDDGQKEEGHVPGESNPETESEDDWFGGEHMYGFDGGGVKHGLDIYSFQVHGSTVALVTGEPA